MLLSLTQYLEQHPHDKELAICVVNSAEVEESRLRTIN